MPRRKRDRSSQAAEDLLAVLTEQYLEWMAMRNYAEDSVATRRTCIGYFNEWCRERGIGDPADVTRAVIERYQRSLYQYRKVNGEPLTFRTQNYRLRSVKGFFRWLARQNHITNNPASELELPRLENRLPKYVLTAGEAEQVLHVPDTTTPGGLRDRAILELFYATGMRRLEVARLKLYDIDADRGTIVVRQGKGKKDRHVPVGERALAWIGKYAAEVRPLLLTGSEEGTVFLTDLGEPYERIHLTALVRMYLRKSNIGKTGGCHLWRHTVATLMLENGADVRVIQELLGHAKLSTTELYTRVSINLLRQVYAATHPAAKLKGQRAAEAAELLSSLAAEQDAEEDDDV